jgi:hypothetical protein
MVGGMVKVGFSFLPLYNDRLIYLVYSGARRVWLILFDREQLYSMDDHFFEAGCGGTKALSRRGCD